MVEWHYSDGELTDAFLARFDVTARERFEGLLRSRTAQFEAAKDDLTLLVSDVEESYRPAMRDALIELMDTSDASVSEKAETFADTYLIDMKMSGCDRVTRVRQAITTMQRLIFSGGSGLLENPNLRLNSLDFDEAWKWLGTFETWRSAVAVYLYPENFLDPALRRSSSHGFKVLCDELRSSASVEEVDEVAEHFRRTSTESERCGSEQLAPSWHLSNFRQARANFGAIRIWRVWG